MVRVLTFGTFDRFHPGHRFYLEQAKKLGTELFVVIARDKTVKEVKGHLPEQDAEARKQAVEASGIADRAVLGTAGDKLDIVLDLKPDIIALGYDQTFFTEDLEARLKNRGLSAKIVKIAPYHPEKYHSSLIRNPG